MNVNSILVIEDSEEDFAMIEQGLADSGVKQKLQHLTNPVQVREWMADPASSASLILLDLNLPGESGVDLLKAFRKNEQHRYTPITILTSSASATDIVHSYHAGANAYHVKPLETPRFESLVKRIVQYWFLDVRSMNPGEPAQ